MSSPVKKVPRVAIIGRPNVGKSTLFNLLTRSRKAVVKNQPGVTRDIQMGTTEWWGKEFEVVDTGGLTNASDEFSVAIKEQVPQIVETVDSLLLIMDGRSGLVPEDRDIVKLAMHSGKPVAIVVNKVDQPHQEDLMKAEFYEFGLDTFATSFERQSGVDEVIEWIFSQSDFEAEAEEMSGIRLAIVGKPNVGKSSLCNHLINSNRMLVSDTAGTTIDSIEIPFSYGETDYILVDTAGLRRSSKRKEDVEIISAFKSYDAIERADVVLLVIDGTEGPTVQDAKTMQFILEKHKAVIVVANKSDRGKLEMSAYRSTFRSQMEDVFHFYQDVPMTFISAKTGSGIKDMFALIDKVWGQVNMRIKTSKLNDFFVKSIRSAPAPVYGSRNVKFYYLTQTKQTPPSFIAFANHPDGVTPSYKRFLSKRIQAEFGLEGIPVRIYCMKKSSKKKNSKYSEESVDVQKSEIEVAVVHD
tara:strand:- start:216989 stop:218395 length:1407 start_codon:yes stop_codon:yes gene_type:complete